MTDPRDEIIENLTYRLNEIIKYVEDMSPVSSNEAYRNSRSHLMRLANEADACLGKSQDQLNMLKIKSDKPYKQAGFINVDKDEYSTEITYGVSSSGKVEMNLKIKGLEMHDPRRKND